MPFIPIVYTKYIAVAAAVVVVAYYWIELLAFCVWCGVVRVSVCVWCACVCAASIESSEVQCGCRRKNI